jgi:hypothetical protein
MLEDYIQSKFEKALDGFNIIVERKHFDIKITCIRDDYICTANIDILRTDDDYLDITIKMLMAYIEIDENI